MYKKKGKKNHHFSHLVVVVVLVYIYADLTLTPFIIMMKNILENLGIDGVFVHTYHATYVRMIFFYVTRMRMRGKRGKKMKNVIENERMK